MTPTNRTWKPCANGARVECRRLVVRSTFPSCAVSPAFVPRCFGWLNFFFHQNLASAELASPTLRRQREGLSKRSPRFFYVYLYLVLALRSQNFVTIQRDTRLARNRNVPSSSISWFVSCFVLHLRKYTFWVSGLVTRKTCPQGFTVTTFLVLAIEFSRSKTTPLAQSFN